MKKWLCLLLVGALTFSLAACHRDQNPDTLPTESTGAKQADSTGTVQTESTETAQNENTGATQPNNKEETQPDNKEEKENPYAIREITDGTVTVVGDKKVFNNTQLTLSVPASWKCLTASGEDNVAYYFQDAMMGGNCQLFIDVTFAYFYKERTRDEYLQSFSRSHEDVVIDSLTKETIRGNTCTKVVHSYMEDNTNFIRILYDNLTEGPRLYDFVITYPASERSTYEPVFESIIDSIQFIHAN